MSKFNDRVFGLIMLVIAVAYYYGATRFPVPFGGSEAVGPETGLGRQQQGCGKHAC